MRPFIPLSILCYFLFPFQGQAQSESVQDPSARAREHIDTLCSPAMHGRGYVEKGDEKAAAYIREELKGLGAKPLFEDSYFHPFEVTVNSFPTAMEAIWGEDTLRPGYDFIPDPTSGSSEGKYRTIRVTPPMLKDRKKFRSVRTFGENGDQVAVLDPQKARGDSARNFFAIRYGLAQQGPVIVLGGAEDLTWGVKDTAFQHAILKVDSNRVDLSEEKLRLNVRNKLKKGYETQNVGAIIEGTDSSLKPIVLSAHYDQLGRMGEETYIPGASDNASGTAMALYLAERFAKEKTERPVVLLFFGAEELGILGSKHYTRNPAFPLEEIEFLLNVDIVGGGSEGITVVNGKVHERQLGRLRDMNEEKGFFPKIKARGKAMNSDHYWFSEKGVPAFFIYTLGDVEAYHNVHDTADNLPLTKFDELVSLLERFVREYE